MLVEVLQCFSIHFAVESPGAGLVHAECLELSAQLAGLLFIGTRLLLEFLSGLHLLLDVGDQ